MDTDLFLALAAVVASVGILLTSFRLGRDLGRLRALEREAKQRALEPEWKTLPLEGFDESASEAVLERMARDLAHKIERQRDGLPHESVIIELTTPAGLVLLPLRPDDPESIGRFLKEAEKARGERAYAAG